MEDIVYVLSCDSSDLEDYKIFMKYEDALDYYKTVLMSCYKFVGWTNPYKGFSLMISRTIPHFMISMTITDYIKLYLR